MRCDTLSRCGGIYNNIEETALVARLAVVQIACVVCIPYHGWGVRERLRRVHAFMSFVVLATAIFASCRGSCLSSECFVI